MMDALKERIEELFEFLDLDEVSIKAIRSVSTIALVLGVSITLSALIFPRYPASFLETLLGDYPVYLEALGVGERTFSLISGFVLFSLGSIVHFLLDIHAGTFQKMGEYSRKAKTRIVVLTSFFFSFVIARVAVILSGIVGPETSSGMAGFLPINEIWISGYHVHHFFFGFLALTLAGWFMLFHEDISDYYTGALYGTGLGIFIDEFGMLLTEGDYFAESSYFIAMTFLSLLFMGIYWDRLVISRES